MHADTDALTAEFNSLVPPPPPLSRRGFLVTALGAGFALAVQPVMAQTAISTDSEGLTAGEIQVPTPDGNMPAYRAQPAQGSNFPVILVVQEIFGVHEYIKDTCRRLAKLGYQAIAPELYARQGDPRQYGEIPDILTKVVNKVPDKQVMADLDACVAWAKANGGDTARLGVTGFCWGGRITWLYARPQSRREGRRGLVRPPHQPGKRDDAEASAGPGRQAARTGARSLRRAGPGHPARHRGENEGSAGGIRQSCQQGFSHPPLSRRAPRVPRRLPRQLPQGGGGGRLEADARVVQAARGLIPR